MYILQGVNTRSPINYIMLSNRSASPVLAIITLNEPYISM